MAETIDDTKTFTIPLTPPPPPPPKFSVGDHVCTDQSELSHWFPASIDTMYDDGSYRAIGDNGTPFKITPDWEEYLYTCVEEEPPIDACTGITCPNVCSDGSLYSQKCVDGVCKKGVLLKSPANAPECADIPPDEEPYDEIIDEPDLMPGQTCVGSDLYQLISGGLTGALIEANSSKCIGVEPVPPEDEGIFGDIDTKWIIVAAIGIIILGLLS